MGYSLSYLASQVARCPLCMRPSAAACCVGSPTGLPRRHEFSLTAILSLRVKWKQLASEVSFLLFLVLSTYSPAHGPFVSRICVISNELSASTSHGTTSIMYICFILPHLTTLGWHLGARAYIPEDLARPFQHQRHSGWMAFGSFSPSQS